MIRQSIDLNLDAGESAEALRNGSEAALYDLVSSVNIACGGHAGDLESMRNAIAIAAMRGLAVGAHPGYPDKPGFGRQKIKIDRNQLIDSLTSQLSNIKKLCFEAGVRLRHVKPHGALYHTVVSEREEALTFLEAVKRIDDQIIVVGFSGSKLKGWCAEQGLQFSAEAFVDRHYEATGLLRSRQLPNALIEDENKAAEQALSIVINGEVTCVTGQKLKVAAETLCIHGDTPNALLIARSVRSMLQQSGVIIAGLRTK